MEILGIAGQDLVGITFLVAIVAFGIGVEIPGRAGMDRSVFGTASTQKYLEIIRSNSRAWRWSAAWLGAGTILNMLGFSLLAVLLSDAGGSLLSAAGALIFVSGGLFMVMGMGFRMGVEPVAAKVLSETSAVPAWFEAVQGWNTTIGMMYMLLAYVGTAIFGGALLQTALLPAWFGWVSLVLGMVGGLSILAGLPRYPGTEYSVAAVPAWIHIIPLVMSIALLVQG